MVSNWFVCTVLYTLVVGFYNNVVPVKRNALYHDIFYQDKNTFLMKKNHTKHQS